MNLFNQGGLAFLRDAWIAAEFGRIRQAKHVHLVADNWPDFQLKIHGQVEAFEAVEADDPERRRGDEYRQGIGEIEDDPVEDWVARAEQASAWLDAACCKKLNRCYSARTNLVIYLNLNEHGVRQQNVAGCFPTATVKVKDSFDAVWVLWKERAYRVWSYGQLRTDQVATSGMVCGSPFLVRSPESWIAWTMNSVLRGKKSSPIRVRHKGGGSPSLLSVPALGRDWYVSNAKRRS